MKNYSRFKTFRLRPLVVGLAFASALGAVNAKELGETTGLIDAAVGDVNETQFMKNMGLKFGGWINAGVTYNAASPDNKFNGPLTFGDRAEELQLNQFYLFMQRAVATEGDSWDVGGRVDFMYGSDSIFTQAYGVPAYDVNSGVPMVRNHWDLHLLSHSNRFYDIALPQAYLETYVPVGNGLNIKAGHFYTPIGYEVVTAPDNFFYTKPYTFQYGEPFTHTGFLGNYAVDQNWSVMGGAVTGSATGGWDGGWDQQLGSWAGIGGVTWTSEDKGTSANISGTYGGTSEHSGQPWALYSVVLKHNITDQLHLVLQHDHGFANKVITPNTQFDANGNPISSTKENATWYGVNTYLFYDILDNLGAGIRGEWFRDDDGFRVCSPARVGAATYNSDAGAQSFASGQNNLGALCSGSTGANFYAFTVGMTYKPLKWVNIRPNVRYDWVDGSSPLGGAYRPFGNNKQDQFVFSTDVVISF